jgi:predicted nuclease of predicted toxin-antitoxin system
MKLLFDENPSFRLCERLASLFPGSVHVRSVGLAEADDRAIWDFARSLTAQQSSLK